MAPGFLSIVDGSGSQGSLHTHFSSFLSFIIFLFLCFRMCHNSESSRRGKKEDLGHRKRGKAKEKEKKEEEKRTRGEGGNNTERELFDPNKHGPLVGQKRGLIFFPFFFFFLLIFTNISFFFQRMLWKAFVGSNSLTHFSRFSFFFSFPRSLDIH